MLLTGIVTFAQNWTGNVDSDWNNQANWSSWPLSGQDITINPANYTGNAMQPIISANSVFSPAEVNLANGAQLTISADLTTQDDVTATDAGTQIIMTAGTFQVAPGNGGRLIIDLGALLVQQSGTLQVDERFIAGEDATVVINGGMAASGERLLMDLGGHFIQNGGTVTVAQTFAMADGNANGSSRYELHGGSLTITGEMAFENEAGNFEPEFFITSGNLVLNGNMTWFGEAPGSGTPRFTAFGGTINITGTIENLPLSTVDMYIDLNGTANMTYNGSAITLLHATDTIHQTAASTLIILGTNTITNPGVILADNGVMTSFLGSSTLTGSGSCDLASVLIQGGATLSLQQMLGIKNNWQNNGQFNAGTEQVHFHGNTQQAILGSSETSFYNLHIENALGVELQQNAFVSTMLDLELGNITTTTSELLTLTDNALAQNASALSFVDGPLRKIGDDTFTFPVGKGTQFAPCSISAPASASAQYDAEFFDAAYSNTTSVNTPLSAVSPSQYWQLSATGNTVQLGLHWDDATQAGISDCASTTIAYWNGSAWENVLSTAAGVCSGNGSGMVESDNALAASGIFTFGFFGNVTTQNFGVCPGDSVEIQSQFYDLDTTLIHVYTASGGEDSTVISHVTIYPVPVFSQTFTICAGESVQVGSSVYTASGTYNDTLVSQYGCDSIVQTQLFVGLPLNVTVTITNNTFTSDPTASSWQWIDCDNGFTPVQGATSSHFSPTQNGNYAVVLTKNGCSDTSACMSIDWLSVDEFGFEHIQLYPNPAANGFSIDGLNTTAEVEVFAADGTRCLKVHYEKGARIGGELGSGVYFVKIRTVSGTSVHKLVVKAQE